MARILDGKQAAQNLKERLKKEVEDLNANNIFPKLSVVLVGDNEASKVYVKNKEKACEAIGMLHETYRLPAETSEIALIEFIQQLNEDTNTHGILVQLPLPEGIDEYKILQTVSPKKDVDCFHPINVGALSIGLEGYLPCTPAGIMALLKQEKIEIAGKKCVIIGRSNIVGKPMALLLLRENGTVTICHSRTNNLMEITKQADILIVAIGKREFITADYIKEGAVVVDVGMNRKENNKLCGDVDYTSCFHKASAITPVPGGVGPMTITMLLDNCLRAAKQS